jgi:hypothetical protein
MSIERSHGKARPTLPRSRELAAAEAVESRTEGRDAHGRFTSGNAWAPGAKWRALIAEGLGRELPGEAGVLGRRAYRLFRAFLADLPIDCASVRSLVAQRARAVALANAYAERGAEFGIATGDGAAAMAEALKWDARAERLAVTSLDVATKLAARLRKTIDTHAAVVEAFGGTEGG